MRSIGQKITELRKLNGLSQEGLAEKAKVNLRTIQRIENGENKPSGTTLKMICEALDTVPGKILEYGKKEDKAVLNLMHLSVLTYFVIPIGNILVPLIFWLTKKEKVSEVDEKGLRLLNFQLIWTIFTSLTFVALLLTAYPGNSGVSDIFLYMFIFLNIINIGFAVVVTMRLSKSRLNSFPKTIQIIK